MLIPNNDGTFSVGGLDIVCILHNTNTHTYHAAFFEESPLPGPVKSIKDTEFIRLKSKMHHTTGTKTIEDALVELKNLSQQLNVPEKNIFKDPIDWGGELGSILLVKNWLK